MNSNSKPTYFFERDTLRYILSLIDGDPARNVYIRTQGSMPDYDRCIEAGWIEEVERRKIDTWPGEERTYRLTRNGYEYAKREGVIV